MKIVFSKRIIISLLILFFILLAIFLFIYQRATSLTISMDVNEFAYSEEYDYYELSDGFSAFTGSISGGAGFIKAFNYEIYDSQDILVSSGSVSYDSTTWCIESPGMMMGIHTLKLIVRTIVGFDISLSYTVVNMDRSMLANIDISMDDSDGDGILDYYELAYGTDVRLADTDGDGLSDYVEIVYTATDPTLYCTENDGICDADRDSDGDGLTNIEEVNMDLDPGAPDTDGDGTIDGEEVLAYATDPLLVDTDGDGASDAWEIENGFDPLAHNDSFEVTQSATANDSKVSVSVTLECIDGGNPETLHVEPTHIEGLLDETMLGYLGSAYSFTYTGTFEQAIITMIFDAAVIEAGADPIIYYFNEETQQLEELETTVLGNTASVIVSHFSTYVLLDRTQVNRIIEEDIVTPDEIDATIVNFAFVIDYSQSMDDNDPEYIRLDIVEEYIGKLRKDKDSATVIKFAGYATTIVPLTTDREMLINGTNSITNTGADACSYDEAGTNGTDGLRHALDELEGADDATYQYIIFLTDGEDTTASYDYDDLVAEAVAHNIVIYTIGLGDCDEELLTSIATATGGKYHYASAVDYDGVLSLEEVFDVIEQDTIDYYTDSNGDGISDYYTKLICDGFLATGTGANPFGDASYDEIQEGGADFDGDGLPNGEEIVIAQDGTYVYLKYNSSPTRDDTDGDGYTDGADERPLMWDVGDRDLAIFAALCYEDGTSYVGHMMSASDIVGSVDEVGETYYFNGFASIDENGLDKTIASNWVIVDYVNILASIDYFSATTYKCQDNIVIAYRGTNEFTEWIDNFVCYGLLNYHTEESYARNYAEKIAAKYPDCNIYITGHSLGGYLAQIGAAELLENATTPTRVAYFNGIGINFEDYAGITDTLINSIALVVETLVPASAGAITAMNTAGTVISTANKILHWYDMAYLYSYAESGQLISYEITGDVVSMLGTHCGTIIQYDPTAACRANHSGNHGSISLGEWVLDGKLTALISLITCNNIDYYYEQYEAQSMMEYFWITHETDSFLYYLNQGTRTASSR